MKRFFAFILTLILMTANAYADILPESNSLAEQDVTFIVEIEGEASLVQKQINKGLDIQTINNDILEDQAKILSSIKKEVSKDIKKGFVYTSLFNGFSLEGKKSQLESIKNIDGVKNVYISKKIPVPEPLLNNAGSIANLSAAYDGQYTGEGQVIAIIDSFCDTGHEFFSTPPDNPKYTKSDIDNILKTKPLNSGASSANQVYKNEKIPYAFDYVSRTSDTYSQTNTHGTHVSGIAAGKNGKLPDGSNFSGVAYNAQIIFMNASKSGYLQTEQTLAALNDAAILDADVINMSFGSDYTEGGLEPLFDKVLDNARKCGISIAASAGNASRGYDDIVPTTSDMDYSSSGSPACFDSVTAVASADNTDINKYYWSMDLKDSDKEMKFYSPFDSSTFDELCKNHYLEYEYCGLGYTSDFDGKDLTGKLALVNRGDITYAEKVTNAASVGAIGIIFINTDNTVPSTVDLTLPAAVVTKNTGEDLKNAENKQVKYIETKLGPLQIESGGRLSYFSSWGVDALLNLKPEITAPGGNIYSSYPDNKYSYASGTSMSSPFIAGSYAIARQYYETNPFLSKYNNKTGEELAEIIENLMMTSADIIFDLNDVPYSPRLQGAGMVNLDNLLKCKVILGGDNGKAKLSLGEISDNFNLTFKITNISDTDVTFDKVSLKLLTDGYFVSGDEYYVDDSYSIQPKSVNMPTSVTVKSGEEYTFNACVKLDPDFVNENMEVFKNGFFVDGFVVLESTSGTDCVSMPFTGFYGDWYGMRVFDTTTYSKDGSALSTSSSPYYTGTFLKALIDDDYYYYVGKNYGDGTIGDEKYLAFSNKGDLTLELNYKNYRTTSKIDFSILDEGGNVVYNDTENELANKFYLNEYAFKNEKVSKLNEGRYTVVAKATVLGNDKVNDTLSIPIVIDNTSPEITSVNYDKETKKLTLSAMDNHYLAFFYLEYDNGKHKYVTAKAEDKNAETGVITKTVDLSDVKDIQTLTIEACDYAMNSVIKPIGIYTDKVSVELKKTGSTVGVTFTDLLVTNNTNDDILSDIIIAYYDTKGLIAIDKKENYLIKSKTPETVSYTFSANTKSATIIKVFLWQPASQTPVDAVKIFY